MDSSGLFASASGSSLKVSSMCPSFGSFTCRFAFFDWSMQSRKTGSEPLRENILDLCSVPCIAKHFGASDGSLIIQSNLAIVMADICSQSCRWSQRKQAKVVIDTLKRLRCGSYFERESHKQFAGAFSSCPEQCLVCVVHLKSLGLREEYSIPGRRSRQLPFAGQLPSLAALLFILPKAQARP
jgi:hypothetical protein